MTESKFISVYVKAKVYFVRAGRTCALNSLAVISLSARWKCCRVGIDSQGSWRKRLCAYANVRVKKKGYLGLYVSHATFPSCRAEQAYHLTAAECDLNKTHTQTHTFLDKVGREGLEMLPGEGLPAWLGGIHTAVFTFKFMSKPHTKSQTYCIKEHLKIG